MKRISLVLLLSVITLFVIGQDTLVLRNASLYIGQITITDSDRISISYNKKDGSNSTKVIKTKNIAYTSRKDLPFTPQALVVNGNETSQIPKATNIVSLAKDGYFNIECRVSSDLEIQFPMDVFPLVNGVVCYTDVIKVDSTNADNLYKRAKYWFTDVFKSAKDVIQLDDPTNKTIIGKGLVTTWGSPGLFNPSVKMYINFKLTVSAKDNRYKYELTDITVEYFMQTGRYNYSLPNLFEYNSGSNGKKLAKDINSELTKLILLLKAGMHTELINSDDSW